MRKIPSLKILKHGLIGLFVLVFAYAMVFFFPAFLYAYEYKNQNLQLYSDQPLPANAAEISQSILARIKKSAYFNAQDEYKVFISNEKWRWRFISNVRSHVGGFNIEMCPNNSFIRPSVMAENRIIPPGLSMADASERDLVYFIAHEITHGMMVNGTGHATSLFSTHSWIKEAYADLIAKQSFDYADNLAQLKADAKRLQLSSGLYVRYHLLLLYLLEKKGMSFPEIIEKNPSLEEVTQAFLANQ